MGIQVRPDKVSKENVWATNITRGVVRFSSTDFDIAAGVAEVSPNHVPWAIAPMLTGNTETFISVTYQSYDNTIDFVVPVLDEDDMVSNSAVHLATQQSIKAYVDNSVASVRNEESFQGFRFNVGKVRDFVSVRLSRMSVFNSEACRYIYIPAGKKLQYNSIDGQLRFTDE